MNGLTVEPFDIGGESNPMALQEEPLFYFFFRRYAPFHTFGAGYPLARFNRFEGDHRTGASTSVRVTSRTSGLVRFTRFGIVDSNGSSSGTHIKPILSDEIVGLAKVSMTVVRSTLAGPDLFEFFAHTAGSNPLVKIPPAPDIDTFVRVRVNFSHPNLLVLQGEAFGANFPNLEVFFFSQRSKHSALLLDGRTTGGRDLGPYTRLMGSHSTQSLGKFGGQYRLDERRQLALDYAAAPMNLSTLLPDLDKRAFEAGCEEGKGSYIENPDGSFQCNTSDGGTVKCRDTKSQCTYEG